MIPYYTAYKEVETGVDADGVSNAFMYLYATGEFYIGDMTTSGQFVYSYPTDRNDWLNQAVCQATGYRAAGHSIRWVDGLPFIDAFAPDKVTKD